MTWRQQVKKQYASLIDSFFLRLVSAGSCIEIFYLDQYTNVNRWIEKAAFEESFMKDFLEKVLPVEEGGLLCI